jgi:hypothetical protein
MEGNSNAKSDRNFESKAHIQEKRLFYQMREYMKMISQFTIVLLGVASCIFFFSVGFGYFSFALDILLPHGVFHILAGLSVLLVSILCYLKPKFFLSSLASIGLYVVGFLTLFWEPFLREDRLLTEWSVLYYVYWIYTGIWVVGIAANLINMLFSAYEFGTNLKLRGGKWIRPSISLANLDKRALIMIGVIFISTISAASLHERWFDSNRFITLTPGDYNVEFSGYGEMNPALYTPEIRDAMNRHGFLLIVHHGYWLTPARFNATPFTWFENIETTPEYQFAREQFINGCLYWKTNYPNIRLIILVHGIPCGFTTDYSVTNTTAGVGGTIWQMEKILVTAIEQNLTNVVGVHTDQEDCAEDWFSMSIHETRNRTRNLQATQAYNDFIARIERYSQNTTWQTFFNHQKTLYGPDHSKFLITTTYNGGMVVEGVDNDLDTDVFSMNNVMGIPYDEFLPMLYFQGAKTADLAHYRLYTYMSMLQQTLKKKGWENRIGALLGVSNERLFDVNRTWSQWNGTAQVNVNGYEVLAMQAKITKCFNVKRVSFFVLYDCCGFKGFFDAYGNDVLDRLNATLNGPEGRTPFTIRYMPEVLRVQIDLARDLLLTEVFPIEIIYVAAIIGDIFLVKYVQPKKKKGNV